MPRTAIPSMPRAVIPAKAGTPCLPAARRWTPTFAWTADKARGGLVA